MNGFIEAFSDWGWLWWLLGIFIGFLALEFLDG